MDERVPEHRDSHARSSHGSSLELTPARSADLGKNSVYTHLPKDRNWEICQGTKITRAPCKKTHWRSRTSCRKFWWLAYSRSQSSPWRMWISKQSSICSRGARLGYPMDPVVSVQNENFSGNTKELAKVLGTREESSSHLHWQFLGIRQSLWRSFLESLYVDTTPIGNKWDCWESSVESERRNICCIVANQVWMRNWWADSLECYTNLRNIHDLFSDGKTPNGRRFGEPFKGPVIPFGSLVEYYPISAKDQSRIRQYGKKVLPGIFLGYALYDGWNCKGDIMVAGRWGAGNDGRIGNLRKKTQRKGSNISQREWEIHIPSRRWTNQTSWRRSGTENIHLDSGTSNSRRRSKIFSWRIRRVSSITTSRLTSGCRWSDKWLLVHVRKLHMPPSHWAQSQTLLAERRIILFFTEIHWRLQNYAGKLGCYAWAPHRWLLEYRWIMRFVWFLDRFHPAYSIKWETSRRIFFSEGETDKTASDIQARSLMAGTLERNVKER